MKIIREIEVTLSKLEYYFDENSFTVYIRETFINAENEKVSLCNNHTLEFDEEGQKIISQLKEWIEKNLK